MEEGATAPTSREAGSGRPPEGVDRASIGVRLDDERRRAGLLGDVREAIFGAQDGLVSTLAVVSTVSGATNDRYPVLIAGIAAGLAGIFSMAAGEYLSSKSQREISLAQIGEEREKVAERPEYVQTELAHLLVEDGLPSDEAAVIATMIGHHRQVLLNTKVLRQYGVAVEEAGGSPLQGAAVMGAAFALGALAPILPYLFLPFDIAVYASVVATAGVLFAIGIVKTRWTHGHPFWSGSRSSPSERWQASSDISSGASFPRCSALRRSAARHDQVRLKGVQCRDSRTPS